MQIASQLGLLIRANVFNHLAAKVELACRHHTPSRFASALKGISNRQQSLCTATTKQRIDVHRLRAGMLRLAQLEVRLDDPCMPSAARPSATLRAFERHLSALQAHLPSDAAPAHRDVAALLNPAALSAQGRQLIGRAFWSGLMEARNFQDQVLELATGEAQRACGGASPAIAAIECAMADVLDDILEQQPETSTLSRDSAQALMQEVLEVLTFELHRPTLEMPTQVNAGQATATATATDWDGVATVFWEDLPGTCNPDFITLIQHMVQCGNLLMPLDTGHEVRNGYRNTSYIEEMLPFEATLKASAAPGHAPA